MLRRMRWRALTVSIAAAAACGGERAAEPGPGAPRTADGVAAGEAATASEPSAPAGAPLDEASARLLIASRLRAAGLRVVADVPLGADGVEVTLDGFDPARRIGYEYIAADERGADLDDTERARLAGVAGANVLVIDSADAEAVASAVERFLAAGVRSSPGEKNREDAEDAKSNRQGPGAQDG